MEYQGLRVEIKDQVAVIIFTRTQVLNVLNSEILSQLDMVLKQLSRDKDIKVIIITGEGKAFVAGADIQELSEMTPSKAYSFSRKGQQVFRRLELMDIPVIAAINGYALGGGCELALACDIRIASSNAKMGMPEVSLGLMPGFAGTQRLCHLIGYANAMYLMLTAESINADDALRLGMVQMVVEPHQLMEVSMDVAQKIASRGKYAVKAVKELARKSMPSEFEDASELESEVFAGLFCRPEADEGIKAFLEKRKPRWNN
jgi:enoyl-CoA hydratase